MREHTWRGSGAANTLPSVEAASQKQESLICELRKGCFWKSQDAFANLVYHPGIETSVLSVGFPP